MASQTFVPEHFDRVFTQDRSSGKYHVRLRDERGRYWEQTQCNLPQAGLFTEVAEIPAQTPNGLLCQNCFPPIR